MKGKERWAWATQNTQNHCLGVQQLRQNSQGSAGDQSRKGCEGGVKKASVNTSAAKGQLNKLWGCCTMGAGNLVIKYMEKAEKIPLSFLLVKSVPRPVSSTSLPEKSVLHAESNWSHLHIHNPETRIGTSSGAETAGWWRCEATTLKRPIQSDKGVLVTRTNITPILKSKKEDLGNYKMSVHLCSSEVYGANVPGRHFQAYEERDIWNNQFGFTKSQLTN